MNNELTIQDLAVMRSIIDAATRGGVFKAQDLSAVGVVHDKLNNIIETFIEKNKETTENEKVAEETATE